MQLTFNDFQRAATANGTELRSLHVEENQHGQPRIVTSPLKVETRSVAVLHGVEIVGRFEEVDGKGAADHEKTQFAILKSIAEAYGEDVAEMTKNRFFQPALKLKETDADIARPTTNMTIQSIGKFIQRHNNEILDAIFRKSDVKAAVDILASKPIPEYLGLMTQLADTLLRMEKNKALNIIQQLVEHEAKRLEQDVLSTKDKANIAADLIKCMQQLDNNDELKKCFSKSIEQNKETYLRHLAFCENAGAAQTFAETAMDLPQGWRKQYVLANQNDFLKLGQSSQTTILSELTGLSLSQENFGKIFSGGNGAKILESAKKEGWMPPENASMQQQFRTFIMHFLMTAGRARDSIQSTGSAIYRASINDKPVQLLLQFDRPGNVCGISLSEQFDRNLALAPELEKDVVDLMENGWKLKVENKSSASYSDSGKKLISLSGLVFGKEGLYDINATAHEVGHAYSPLSKEPQEYANEQEYVDACAMEEGVAARREIKTLYELPVEYRDGYREVLHTVHGNYADGMIASYNAFQNNEIDERTMLRRLGARYKEAKPSNVAHLDNVTYQEQWINKYRTNTGWVKTHTARIAAETGKEHRLYDIKLHTLQSLGNGKPLFVLQSTLDNMPGWAGQPLELNQLVKDIFNWVRIPTDEKVHGFEFEREKKYSAWIDVRQKEKVSLSYEVNQSSGEISKLIIKTRSAMTL